jgi:FtsP/CotA-like multicopper oxidase with cupredoxin domain
VASSLGSIGFVKRSHLILLVLAHVVIVALVVGWLFIGGPLAEDDTIILGGMEQTQDDLDALTKRTMGERHLRDVEVRGPKDATRDLEGSIVDGIRTFELTARPVRWEYRAGQSVAVWAYDGQVPGPTLHMREGERVRVKVTNDLPEGTTVHWHGVDVPSSEDGVPGVTQAPIEPGETYTYEFTAKPSGTRWYHTHGKRSDEELPQLDMGLSGALVITPRAAPAAPDVDKVLVLDEWHVGSGGYNAAMLGGHASHAGGDANLFTINGSADPDVPDIVVKRGDRVRLRFVNASSRAIHPMHLHGHQMRIVALDGNAVPAPLQRTMVPLMPGETADVEFVADNPGRWMLHCHDLHHSDAGMMMFIRYEGWQPLVEDGPGDGHSHSHAASDESMPHEH